jgi:hypothetical protein
MGNLKLQGSQGMLGLPAEIKTAQLRPNVKLAEIQAATHDNDLDELVVKNAQGEITLAYADELSVKDGKMPKAGDKITVDFVEGEVEVLHVDNESNEDWYIGPLGPLLTGKPLTGDEHSLQKLK